MKLKSETVAEKTCTAVPIVLTDTVQLKADTDTTKIAWDEDKPTECLRCLWPFLKLFRLLGLCPILKQRNRLVVPTLFNPYWLLTILVLLIQVTLLFNYMLRAATRENTNDDHHLAEIGISMIYYVQIMCTTLFMIWKIHEIPSFVEACERIEIMCKKYSSATNKKENLVRDCWIVFLVFESTHAVSNGLYYVAAAHLRNSTTPTEYFLSSNNELIRTSGSLYTGMFLTISGIYCDMSWNFGEVLLGILSVILTRYFYRINCGLGRKGAESTVAHIEELRNDHQEIRQLVQLCNEIFSPLFLLTYVANVGYLLVRLYLSVQFDLGHSVFAVHLEGVYAFAYQIFIRILFPSYLAAKLHEDAHAGLEMVHRWPSSVDKAERKSRLLVIGRFAAQFSTTQVGISPEGFFVISKAFLVTLISALITYEVIILQFQAAGNSKSDGLLQNKSAIVN